MWTIYPTEYTYFYDDSFVFDQSLSGRVLCECSRLWDYCPSNEKCIVVTHRSPYINNIYQMIKQFVDVRSKVFLLGINLNLLTNNVSLIIFRCRSKQNTHFY